MTKNWYPGHMAKTKRLISEKYDLIDIVYELIDARIPVSSKISNIDSILKNKPRLLIMTKSDLCDLEVTCEYVKHYEDKGYKVILANLNDSNIVRTIIDETNELMSSLQEKRTNKGLKEKEIRALVIGIPNVGKSTLINKLANRKVANVGNKPGITKNITWLKTNSNILLLDTPGILAPKIDSDMVFLNLASMGTIKKEILSPDEVAIHILKILNTYYPHILKERYKIDSVNIDDILLTYEAIGKNKGLLTKGGEVDETRVSELIINDIKQEYIKGITFDRRESQDD